DAVGKVGVSLLTIMTIPHHKPEKWDAADAVDEGVDVVKLIEDTLSSITHHHDYTTKDIVIEDWLACERFVGEPKPRQWLIDGIFPLGQVSLFAASGGIGKSFLLAQLARE